jgi:hypothetical protein
MIDIGFQWRYWTPKTIDLFKVVFELSEPKKSVTEMFPLLARTKDSVDEGGVAI